MSQPVIKWVGGKRQLIPEIQRRMPKSYSKYIEPFIGGAALFFHLKPLKSIINDYNPELSNLYNVIKKYPIELIEELNTHRISEEYYYWLRGLDRTDEFMNLNDVQRASRFIFLNKMGFNGLYRVNKKGQNNVPYGKYENPKIFDPKNIILCSTQLKDTTILNGDFEQIRHYVEPGDFVYFDPPYVPLTTTANFTSYTSVGFSLEDQIRLRNFIDELTSIDVKCMISNSYTDFILNEYKEYKINTVQANRALNSNGAKRGKVNEVLITNY